jgi:peptide/nickel transport system substrate-binding protein
MDEEATPREEELTEGLADPRAPWEELVEDPAAPRAMLAVMFTDIVGSTELATALGDKRWRELLEQHDKAIREQIARFDGREVDTAGDAFFATFGLAVRAVDCALESARAVRRLGLRIRAGIHMGECVVTEDKVRGVTVHIGARVGAKARGDEVLVSSTVRDILAGAGLKFAERGEQTLKGVEGKWRLYAVEPRVRDNEADLPPLLETEIAGPPKPAWQKPRALAAIGTALAVLIGAIAFVTFRGPGGLASVPADSVAVIDASSGAVESTVSVRRRPVGLTTAPDGIWVANSIDRSITRIRAGGQTDTIPVGPGPIALVAGGDFMWVVNGDASNVSRVSTKTQVAVGAPIQAGNGLSSIAFSEGSDRKPQLDPDDALWLANSVDGSLWKVDPTTGSRTLDVQVGPDPGALAVTTDAVWVVSERAGTLVRVDPKTGVIVRVVRVGNGPIAVAIADGFAWVANAGDATVTRVDTKTYATKDFAVGRGPRAVAVAGDRVFVANEEDGTVSMLSGDGGLIRTIELGNAPMGLTVQGEKIWASVRGGILRYKGGTLRVGISVIPDSLDPGTTFEPAVYTLMSPAVYDGLTSFKRIGGPEGNQLVPNLAEEIRPPTKDGLTYTYTLRKGLKYSDGTPVRASDVRKTFERSLRNEGYGGAFIVILKGAEACTPQVCDLSSGIVTDDEAGSIVFHLRSPLADFPYQLALPSLSILPGKTPIENQGMTPIPGTGPYRIASAKFTPAPPSEPTQGTVVLERNANFVARGLAQPDGYPDRIEFNFGGDPEDLARAVKAGRSDITPEFGDSGEFGLDNLATEFPAQVHLFEMPANAFLSLNNKLPPFNNLDARRALSFALDREKMARATDDLLGDISCQLLPKNTVGYVPYCPYTKNPSDAQVWTGPDLETARMLVERSGTAGQRVTVWTQEGEGYGAFQRARRAPIIVDALNAIGYRATVREFPGDYFEGFISEDSIIQVALTGWISDYPAASNFVLSLATCSATLERLGMADIFQANGAKFCDAEVDALTEQALKAQQEDPGGSRDAWAKVDRLIADKAPYVIVGNLRNAAFVSPRVGNVQGHATYPLLLTQMWVTEPGSPSPTPGG